MYVQADAADAVLHFSTENATFDKDACQFLVAEINIVGPLDAQFGGDVVRAETGQLLAETLAKRQCHYLRDAEMLSGRQLQLAQGETEESVGAGRRLPAIAHLDRKSVV